MKYFTFLREWLASLLCYLGFSSSSLPTPSSPTSSTQGLKSEASLASSATTETDSLNEKPTKLSPELAWTSPLDASSAPTRANFYLNEKPTKPIDPDLAWPSPFNASSGMSSPAPPRCFLPLGTDSYPTTRRVAQSPGRDRESQLRMKMCVDLATIQPEHMSGRYWFWEECQNEDAGCKNWVWVMGAACHECTNAGKYTDVKFFAGVRHKHELYHPSKLASMEESRKRAIGEDESPKPNEQAFWDLPGADSGGYKSDITSFWNSAIKKHRGDPAAGIPPKSMIATLNLYV